MITDFLRDPALPEPLDPSMLDPSLLAGAPGRLLAVAIDLLLGGDIARSGEYLDLLERAQPPIPPESRLAARFTMARATYCAQTGQVEQAVEAVRAARAIRDRNQLSDEWVAAAPIELLRVYTCLEDFLSLIHI